MTRDLPHLPEKPILNRIACGLVASVLSVTMLGMASARAKADDLEDKRNQLDSQIEAQKSVVEGASKDLTDAIAALDSSKTELAEAEASLAQAESRLSEAKELDSQRAAELKAAETKAEKAQADVAAAQAAYDSVDARTSEEITVITQQSGALAELSVLFNDVGTGNINQRAQLADTLFSSSALELDELTERRFRLDTAKKEADEAEAKAEELRKAAADQLEASKQAEQDAAAKRSEVAEKVAQHDAAREKADSQLNAEKGRQSELESESKDVDRRIQERIEQQKQAEAERQAREREAQQKSSADSGSSSGSGANSGSGSSGSSSNAGFIHPVDGGISSPYGMRVHPVLGYSKLHDGTDFAAGCGTPIRAAGDGVVSERYFNAGYGNRLMIDHGSKGGTYVTTGYNHASSYVVSVGDHVSQGQVIGYVGTTGYSTGCHLHLMAWENGSVVNPMARWFK